MDSALFNLQITTQNQNSHFQESLGHQFSQLPRATRFFKFTFHNSYSRLPLKLIQNTACSELKLYLLQKLPSDAQ